MVKIDFDDFEVDWKGHFDWIIFKENIEQSIQVLLHQIGCIQFILIKINQMKRPWDAFIFKWLIGS